MKNITKFLSLTLVISLLLVFSCNKVFAADTITIKSSKSLSKLITNYDQDFKDYKTTSKKTVYSMQFDKKSLKKDQELTFEKDGDAGLLYILENGYPNKKITGDSETDQYITQAAIWSYLGQTKQAKEVDSILTKENNEKDTYGLVPSYINPLVTKAKEAKTNNYKSAMPEIKTNVKDTTLTLSKNKKYYESGYISVSVKGAKKYNVSSDAKIVDEDGEERASFSASEKFKVLMPVSKISTNPKLVVTVTAKGNENVAKIYKAKDSKYTNVIGLFTKKHNLKNVINLTMPVDNSCKYVDGNYHDKEGKIIDENSYKQACNNICKVIDNKYYDKTGKEVSKKAYEKECKNSCQVDNDIHYGIDGRKVDENTFNKECGHDVVVPNTGLDVSGIGMLFGAFLMVSGFGILYKRKKALN